MEIWYGALIVFVSLFGVLSVAVGRLLRTHGIVFLEQVFGAEGRVAAATKLGTSILVVAVIHFVNMLIFTSLLRRGEIREAEAEWRRPVGPAAS